MKDAIETERLILRPFEIEDASAMYNGWATDDEVLRFLIWPKHESIETSRSIIEIWKEESELPGYTELAIVPKETMIPVGSISLMPVEGDYIRKQTGSLSVLELGYCLARSVWGRGYAPEAAQALIRQAFEKENVDLIVAKYDLNNPKSGRVMEKIGMKPVGILHGFRNNSELCDAQVCEIRRNDIIGR